MKNKNLLPLLPLLLLLLPLIAVQGGPVAAPSRAVPEDTVTALQGDSLPVSTPDSLYNDSIVEVKAEVLRRRGTITPVDNDRTRPPQPILHYYDKHGEALPEPVLFLVEEKDTVVSPRSPYPRFNGVTVGVDFLDGILALFGQKHGSYGVSAEVSLHNWFFPIVEVGVGSGHDCPEGYNFNYKAHLTPYFKIGINYNFLYKSDPKYQACLGLRGGWSTTRFDITDITIDNTYWGEDVPLSIERQKADIWFGEVLAGLRVNIASRFSLGWRIRYRIRIHESKAEQAAPWFYPGYGATAPVSFQFSAYWSF